MDIISKREGPRLEDVKARKMLSENSGVIRRLADQISNGGFSRMQAEKARRNETPQAKGLIMSDLKVRNTVDVPEPYVKVSLNNRVVLVDKASGRQLEMLGEIRGNYFAKSFVIATRENGFFTPVDPEIFTIICDLDKIAISQEFTEDDLVRKLEQLLEIGSEEP